MFGSTRRRRSTRTVYSRPSRGPTEDPREGKGEDVRGPRWSRSGRRIRLQIGVGSRGETSEWRCADFDVHTKK